MLVLQSRSEIGFVSLHAVALQTDVLRHQGTNLLEHAPRGFVRHARLALYLFRADPAASGRHEIHSVEPHPQGCGRLVEDTASHRRDHGTAVVAGIGFTGRYAVVFTLHLAFLTERDVTGAPLLHQPIKARVIVRELSIELLNREPLCRRNGLFHSHVNSMTEVLPDVKGYLPRNKTGFIGVSWKPSHNAYRCQISQNGKTKFLGYFKEKEVAAQRYLEEARKLHGDFLNHHHCRR